MTNRMDPFGDEIYYLSYGTNTNRDVIGLFCPSARVVGKVTLQGYRLRWRKYLDIVRSPGDQVVCLVWKIEDPNELPALDDYEGVDDGLYHRFNIDLNIPGIGYRTAFTYAMSRSLIDYPLRGPTERGEMQVRLGYDQHGLPHEQYETAEGFPGAPVRPEAPETLEERAPTGAELKLKFPKTPAEFKAAALAIQGAKVGIEYELYMPVRSVTWDGYNPIVEFDSQALVDSFHAVVQRPVNYFPKYQARRDPNDRKKILPRPDGEWDIEYDNSLNVVKNPDTGQMEIRLPDDQHFGMEFISPPLEVAEAAQMFVAVQQWAKKNGCYTTESCGLHMSVSAPHDGADVGWTLIDSLNIVKLALLVEDEKVLQEFGRLGNEYCESVLKNIKKYTGDADTIQQSLDMLEQGLTKRAADVIHPAKALEKNRRVSLNVHGKKHYVEFRSPGGDYLNYPADKVLNTMFRFVVGLDAAVNDHKYKHEFRDRLAALLDPQGTIRKERRSASQPGWNSAETNNPFMAWVLDRLLGQKEGPSTEELAKLLAGPQAPAAQQGVQAPAATGPTTQENGMTNLREAESATGVGFKPNEDVYVFMYDQHVSLTNIAGRAPSAVVANKATGGVVKLRGWRLEWRGMGNLTPENSSEVKGRVFKMKAVHLMQLDNFYEVGREGYRKMREQMKIDGKMVWVYFYIMTEKNLELRPYTTPPEKTIKNKINTAYSTVTGLSREELGQSWGWTEHVLSKLQRNFQTIKDDPERMKGGGPKTPKGGYDKKAADERKAQRNNGGGGGGGARPSPGGGGGGGARPAAPRPAGPRTPGTPSMPPQTTAGGGGRPTPSPAPAPAGGPPPAPAGGPPPAPPGGGGGSKPPWAESYVPAPKQKLEEGEQQVVVFAYGSNIHYERLLRRCGRAVMIGTGYVENYRLEFRSYANLERSEGDRAYGIVYKMPISDLGVLNRYEGVASGAYDAVQIKVNMLQVGDPMHGKALTKAMPFDSKKAVVYLMTDQGKKIRKRAKPPAEYLEYIVDGFRAYLAEYVSVISKSPGYGDPERAYQTMNYKTLADMDAAGTLDEFIRSQGLSENKLPKLSLEEQAIVDAIAKKK